MKELQLLLSDTKHFYNRTVYLGSHDDMLSDHVMQKVKRIGSTFAFLMQYNLTPDILIRKSIMSYSLLLFFTQGIPMIFQGEENSPSLRTHGAS